MFPDQPPQGALYFENESLDDNANAHVSWHCSGQRTYSPRVMLNLKSFVIVSVDVLSRPNNNLPILTMDQVPAVISISGKDFPFLVQHCGMVHITYRCFSLMVCG